MVNWPPDYPKELARRGELLNTLRSNPRLKAAALAHYATHPVDWINDWMITVDPRAALKIMPFIMFPRQIDLVNALQQCLADQESALVEKSRDMGASWTVIGFLTWCWLFIPDANLGLGSRKEILVDRLSDRSTLFEKVRMVIRWLPEDIFWPPGFNEKDHMPYMRILNPANGSTIMGEAGRSIGRGGRYLLYVVDEEAFLEDQEATDSSLGDATRCRVSISTYNQMNDLFHRRRKAGLELPATEPGRLRVFVMDWRDHPAKTPEWYDQRRAKAMAEGTLHLFAREVDRDPSAAQSNVLIPGLWVSAAIDAHIKLGIEPSGDRVAAMDVADDGADVNAQCQRHGILVQSCCSEGGEADTVGRKYYTKAIASRCHQWRYEVNGVGAGARAGARGVQGATLPIVPWNPAAGVVRPMADITTGKVGKEAERRNKDHYLNANSQAWWGLRERFRLTYLAVAEGAQFDPDTLISLDSRMEGLTALQAELSQPVWATNTAGKITVDKKPTGSKSPNLADAVKIAFAELPAAPEQPAVAVGGVGSVAGVVTSV